MPDGRFALDPEVGAYYDEGGEQSRLTAQLAVEFARTGELLARFLPPPPARVLDVGGGAGVYAGPLAKEGYDVHLVDPVRLHVDQARAAGVAKASLGDARALAFADQTVHAVLLFGPLYHLTDREDRIGALAEARRVLRPGGVVCAAAISRFASTYAGLLAGFLDEPGFEEIVQRDVAEGLHLNPTLRPHWFTTSYFHRPDELAAELAEAGLSVEALVAVEGPAQFMPDELAAEWLADPDRRERLMRALRRVEAEPSILGATSHLLAVGRAPA